MTIPAPPTKDTIVALFLFFERETHFFCLIVFFERTFIFFVLYVEKINNTRHHITLLRPSR